MSGWNSDVDYYDWLAGPYMTCTCVDCGEDFREPFDNPQTLCEDCCHSRDEHTTALERRLLEVGLQAVKAALENKREVA